MIAASTASFVCPTRRNGTRALVLAKNAARASAERCCQAGVSIVPGEMQLTRIGASSNANPRAIVSMAPLMTATLVIPDQGILEIVPENIVNDPPGLIFI